MYRTCLFCNSDLGRNEAVEHFLVGHRLAFDAARGRLWVICASCARWNLTPIEERWEAIEDCERLFAATHLRRSTGEIGLAVAPDGTELVRVGMPLRPEFAAWRYAARFAARRAASVVRASAALGGMVLGGAAVGLLGAMATNTMPLVATCAGIGLSCEASAVLMWRRAQRRVVARIGVGDGRVGSVSAPLARHARLRWDHDDVWRIDVPVILREGTRPREIYATGDDARTLARAVLPALNGYGARARVVIDAVGVLDDAGSPDRVFRRALRHDVQDRVRREAMGHRPGALVALPVEIRLALEMATHEELEQRALDGELADLERAWREAEVIAAIADGLP